MNELIVANIDANMGDGMPNHMKKQEISWAEMVNADGLAFMAQKPGVMGKEYFVDMVEYNPYETAAIQTCCRFIPAEPIIHAHEG